MKKFWNPLNQLPLQVTLTLPLILQAIGAFGGVGYLSFKNSQAAVNDIANQLRGELAARISREFADILTPPHIINDINAGLLAEGQLNLLTGEGEQQLWQQARMFPSTNLVYCATESDGAFLGVGRTNSMAGDSLQVHVSNAETNFQVQEYNIDRLGNRGSLRFQDERYYDPRVRPWYTATKAAGRPVWSDVYLDFETQLPTITANAPVFDTATQQLIGVCAADIILPKELNLFLSSLEISNSGISFVMDENGDLISASHNAADRITSSSDNGLIAAQDSNNQLIRQVSNHLTTVYGDLDRVQSGQLDMQLDHDLYFLEIIRLQDLYGLDWIIVLAMPESDFMAQIHANTKLTFLLSLMMLLASVIVGFLLTVWVTRPLSQLSTAATDIARGEWDRSITINRADAIGDLSRSIAAMAHQLKDLFLTLEHRIEERTTELTRANQELQRLAHVDGLTHVANRRYFDQILKQEWRRLVRSPAPLTLILCDVDYFKQYNDLYGHQAGDRCLQIIATLLDGTMRRPGDLVARYGGEEFAIILPETDQAGGIWLVEKLQTLLVDLNIDHAASTYQRVTISYGIATLMPSRNHQEQELITAADQALYAAKSAGRNRYEVATL